MTDVVIRRKFGHGHTQREEGPVTTEAEKRVLLLPARQHQLPGRTATSQQRLEEARRTPSLKPSEGMAGPPP